MTAAAPTFPPILLPSVNIFITLCGISLGALIRGISTGWGQYLTSRGTSYSGSEILCVCVCVCARVRVCAPLLNCTVSFWGCSSRWMNGCRALVKWYWLGRTKLLGEKPTPFPVSHKSHFIWQWEQTWVSILRGQWLCAPAMAPPPPIHTVLGRFHPFYRPWRPLRWVDI